jgi:RNA polymerase sigma factor (sigma-70 family)
MADRSLHSSIRDILRRLKAREVKRLPDADLLARYVRSRDEAAFAALVSRHGPTVLSVCRRVLRGADVDDAFQATFLALAKEAGSIRRQEAVGAWLYEVAYHTALRAKARHTRIQRVERAAASAEGSDLADETVDRDVRRVLDEELHRLPERLRRPLVLVHLLGHVQADAARELGITDRTLRRRLLTGRERLRERLTSRGVTLTAVALAAVLDRPAAAGPVPPGLFRPTVESALAYAAGRAGAVPAATASLATSGVGGWLAHKLKLIGVLVGIPALAALVFTAHALTPAVPEAPQDPPVPGVATAETTDARTQVLTGRVLDAAGRPVPHAAVTALVRRPWQPNDRELHDAVVARTNTDAAGRYAVTVPRDFPTLDPERRVTLLAHAAGHAPIVGKVSLRSTPAATELRLPAGTTAHGRLLAPDGRPATGVRLAVVRLGRTARGSGDGDEPPPGWPADVTTDAEGRYRLDGLPPGETLWLQVQDDRYARTSFAATAGAAEPPPVALAEPRVLTGRVYDRSTERPLHGARIAVMAGDSQKVNDHFGQLAADPSAADAPVEFVARTDAEGRFRLRLPPDENFQVFAYPPDGADYAARWGKLVWGEGETTRDLNLWMLPGVAVEGRVVEEDGRPVAGASAYFLMAGAKGVSRTRAEAMVFRDAGTLTDRDGRFRLVVLPGPCYVSVVGPTSDYRLQDYTPQRCPNCGLDHLRFCEHARVEVTLDRAAPPEPLRIVLRRGVTITGRAVGPDGEPIREGVAVCRSVIHPLHGQVPRTLPIRDGRFELPGCVPGRTYPVLLFDAAHALAAVAEVHVPAAGEAPPTVRLAPCGTADVRLVDAAGEPLAGHRPRVHFWLAYDRPAGEPDDGRQRPDSIFQSWIDPSHYLPGPATDAAGTVSLPALIPGLEYKAGFMVGGQERLTEPFRVGPGQTVRLPDVVVPQEPAADGHAAGKP